MARGSDDIAPAFDRITDEIARGAGDVVRRHGDRIAAIARARLTRVDTGQIREGLRARMLKGRPQRPTAVVRVFDVGIEITGRHAGRQRPANLPQWIEYGTRKQSPAPFMEPAAEADRAAFDADLQSMVDGVIAKWGR